MLRLARQSQSSWYADRLSEELHERATAPTLILKLSETSDVFFTLNRAQHDGFPLRPYLPAIAPPRNLIV